MTKEVERLHADWWQARIARQQEIDDSIAARAEFEFLYDKPYDDKKTVRVAGPYTCLLYTSELPTTILV